MTGPEKTANQPSRQNHCFQWFSSQWFRGFRAARIERGAVVLAVAIALSACATGPRHHAGYYRPADGSYLTVRVQDGDTLSEIAQRYRVEQDDIAAMNRLHDQDVLYAGEVLRIPAYGRVAYVPPRTRPQPATRPQTWQPSYRQQHDPRVVEPASRHEARIVEPHVSPSTIPRPIPKPHVASRPVETASSDRPPREIESADLPPPTSTSSKPTASQHAAAVANAQFMWPLDGIVISNFGSRTGGERNDGINIACTGGEEIRAAADGTVMYAGNELKAYGNLVLIKHGSNFTTAYAHVDRIVVARGAHVTKGQIIAYAGSTGDVAEPQLHFELRKGTTPIDPRPYLALNN